MALPYLGEVRLRLLTMNVLVWVESNPIEAPYPFLKAYLQEHAKPANGGKLEIESLSDDKLDEIADVLCLAIYERGDGDENLTSPSTPFHKAEDFQKLLQARLNEMRELTKETARRITRTIGSLKGGVGSLMGTKSILASLETPGMKLMRTMQNDMRFMDKFIIKPVWMDSFEAISHQTSALAEIFKPILPILTPPRDFVDLAERISKQFVVFQPSVLDSLVSRTRSNLTSESYVLRGLKRPGFDFTAQVGLNGTAPKAATAALLNAYLENASVDDTAFSATLECLYSIDEITEEDLNPIIEVAIAGNETIVQNGSNIHSGNLLHLLAVLLSVIAILQNHTDDSETILGEVLEEFQAGRATIEMQISNQSYRYKHDRRLTSRYHLRDGPHKEATSLTILNPDQIVTVIKVQGNWAYVEVMPYQSEPLLQGWVYRGGLAPF